ncbi:MAG: UDP-N-acetylmuramate--L-alanine ligase [Pseudanabaenaceae cyanobacterium bins.68]|nr:UDP-N-acetylmuramate--L-alanine ligase [Pseudanabaenaceae cyanobacterium bins.68]
METIDFSGRPFHFIGVGGIGMSAIAHILARQGFVVSGSDTSSNGVTTQLQQLGVKIFQGHSRDHISLAASPQVVCSTAISPDNEELQAALSYNLPIWHRSDLLAALITQFHSIAVAGTHGKTTTSSLIAYLLLEAGLDPTIVVGGEVNAWQGNARLGCSNYLVAEADESDGSFVKFHPKIGVVTNIELDHPDFYRDLDQVIGVFQQFAQGCGTLVACIDDLNVVAQLQPHLSYSLKDPTANYYATEIEFKAAHTQALIWENSQPLGKICLKILGAHNLSNALAAIAVCRHLGIAWSSIQSALPNFVGAKRRFELRGLVKGISLIDDYAHHPSEIRATLTAAKLQSQGRLVAIFQPHRYTRTAKFLAEFAECFEQADLVVITDIYSAGEANPTGLTGAEVAKAIAQHHPQVYYQPEFEHLKQFLVKHLQAQDLAIFLGAGNLNAIIPDLVNQISVS